MKTDSPLLRVGVLGCGPIAQFAHLDACRKARNVELQAICDVAEDLRSRMAAVHQPRSVYGDYQAMLNDPRIDAVVIGISDAFHVDACRQAIAAGKHVLVEKPLGLTIEECLQLKDEVTASGRVLQVGNNRRFDPGIMFAARFVREEIGGLMAFKGWYHDSVYRYTMTDNLQPIPVRSEQARRPEVDPRANRQTYFLLTHGSHLVDTARFLAGPIAAVRARFLHRFDAYGWFVEVSFADGSLGHLDLQIPIRGDFEEGFSIQGEHGSVKGRVHLPWFHKSSDVECFSTKDRQYRRPLGEDAHTYKRQLEGFAQTILEGTPMIGANVVDGLEAMRALVAISRSVQTGETIALAEVAGGV